MLNVDADKTCDCVDQGFYETCLWRWNLMNVGRCRWYLT